MTFLQEQAGWSWHSLIACHVGRLVILPTRLAFTIVPIDEIQAGLIPMTIARVLLMQLIVAYSLSIAASAAPLDKDACEQLKTDLAAMSAVKDHIAKGPEWGKANLSAEQIRNVERYIQMEEQIAFRCIVRKAPVEAAATKAPRPKVKKAGKGPDAAEVDGAAAKAQDAPVKASAAPRPKVAPKPQAEQQGSGVEAVAGKATPPPARKTAPKPKANDAFVPPASGAALPPAKQ